MRVVLAVCGTKEYYGMPKYFYFLAKHLILNGVEVKLIMDSWKGINRLHETFGARDESYLQDTVRFRVIGPAARGVVSKALFSWNVARYLKNKDFDVLHTCDVIPYFYLRQRNRRPVVFQPFGSELLQMGGIKRLFHFVLRSCGQRADALAIEGGWQLDEVIGLYGVNQEKTFVLPVGIDIDFIRNKVSQREVAGGMVDIPEDAFVILSVNSLYQYKGIDYLIRAFQDVWRCVPEAYLVIVGSGPEEGNLQRLASELGLINRVMFVKNVAEKSLYSFYADADVFVSPTLQTDTITGILEAEVFGLPIVSTHQEFLIDGNGFVVPEKNPRALAEAILKVHEGNRLAMGKRSREIVKQYDFKEIAKTAISKYEELV